MNSILISDVFCRKSFDVISILKQKFPNDRFLLGINTVDRWAKLKVYLLYGKVETVRLRTKNEQEFNQDITLISKLNENHKIVYIPIEEETTEHFIRYVSTVGKRNFIYRLPLFPLYETFQNKAKLNQYCLAKKHPAPRIYEIPNFQDSDYPILLKPCFGSGSKGIVRLWNPADYTDDIRDQIQNDSYLAQELLSNGKDVYGAFFLCDKGKVISAYSHKRIRTMPEEGGVTVLSQMDYNDVLIAQGKKLLEEVGWSGLIMLEYLYDEKDNIYKLIEANPRLWGSIMLSEYGGSYLLSNYVRICLGEKCKRSNIDLKCCIRWFFPMDLALCVGKRGKIKHFWNFKNTCFINWSYARKDRAIFFILLSVFNPAYILKFFS